MGTLAQIGLALATAVGAWVNLLLVLVFAVRRGYLAFDREWVKSLRQVRDRRHRAGGGTVADGAVCWRLFRANECIPRRDRAVAADRKRCFVLLFSILLLFGRGWIFSLIRG